jgi:hypothetical protein
VQTFFAVVGCLVAVLAFGLVLFGLTFVILDRVDRLLDRVLADARENARHELGDGLARMAYWFSESEPAEAALRAVGESIRATGRLDLSDARDRWRARDADVAVVSEEGTAS